MILLNLCFSSEWFLILNLGPLRLRDCWLAYPAAPDKSGQMGLDFVYCSDVA